MGIYPTEVRQYTLDRSVYSVTVGTPGHKVTYIYELACVIEERTNCYCCSCDPDSSVSDPYCRNHGFAGLRPCEVHSMPGKRAVGPDGEDWGMPESVQHVRAIQKENADAAQEE